MLELERATEARRYEAYVRAKRARPTRDLYAIFQPFNEATRAAEPLLELLRPALAPGDLVLDAWCRTGWTGEWLAAALPEQRVIALWEGDRDTLGYRGFDFWLGDGARRPNLSLAFADPREPLPFEDRTFALIFAADALHRFEHPAFASELLRVSRPGGGILFPHVHLTNGVPDPFFERGETQRHGTEWQELFDDLTRGTGRALFILPERALFEGETRVLEGDPETPGYNGLLAVLPSALRGAPLPGRGRPALEPGDRLVSCDLARFDLAMGRVTLDERHLDEGTGALLFRHPVQRARLARALPLDLDGDQCRLLFLARRGLTVLELGRSAGLSAAEVGRVLGPLLERELLRALPVSAGMVRLQSYFAEQELLSAPELETLDRLWHRAVSRFGARPYLLDAESGELFTYSELSVVVDRVIAALAAGGVGRGDVVMTWAPPNVEQVALFWATVLSGAVFVPLDPAAPIAALESIAAELPIALLAVAPELPAPTGGARTVLSFGVAGGAGQGSFADWLDLAPEPGDAAATARPGAREEDVAVVLFTSGTTGRPKGVRLSHGSLFRTAELVATELGLREDDRLLSPAPYSAMSGLRNPILATACTGALAIVPDRSALASTLGALGLVERTGATVLTTVPAFLERWVRERGRVPAEQLHTLRCVSSTASALSMGTARVLLEHYPLELHEYYGLTESGGICAARTVTSTSGDRRLGRPRGAVLQVVDDAGTPVAPEVPGELRVYSQNLMRGYVGDASGLVVSAGWLYTGDLAVVRGDGDLELLGRRRRIIKLADGALLDLDGVERLLAEHLPASALRAVPAEAAEGREGWLALLGPGAPAEVEVRAAIERALGPGRGPTAVLRADQDRG